LYNIDNNDYSKVLIKIGLQICNETIFKEHPEITLRRNYLLNNLACLYEKIKEYYKALKYFKLCINLSVTNLDYAVVYNNMSRIYLYLDEYGAAYQNSKLCFDYFKLEMDKVMNNKFSENKSKSNIELISFLYYNYALALEKFGRVEESQFAFRKGYEFSVGFLGEYHINTNKYPIKMKRNKTSTMTDTVITSSDSNCSSPLKKKLSYKIPSFKKIIRRDYSFNESLKTKNAEMDDLRLKMDLVLKKVNKFDSIEKTLNEVIRSKSRDIIEPKTDYRKDSPKNNSLIQYIKKDVNKLVKSFSSNFMDESPIRSAMQDTKTISKDELYINEFVNQLALDENFIANRISTLPAIDRVNSPKKKTSNTVANAEHQPNNKRTLKDMFSKVIGEYKPNKPEGKLAEMIRVFSREQSPTKNDSNSSIRKIRGTVKLNSPSKDSNVTKEFKITIEGNAEQEPKSYLINIENDRSDDTYKSKTFYIKDQEHLTNELLYNKYCVSNIIDYQTYTAYNNGIEFLI
jgi:tetratricopeptide (TPR) repeat protein